VRLALIDTGPMVALFDANDIGHRHYTGLLAQGWRLTTTWPCVRCADDLHHGTHACQQLRGQRVHLAYGSCDCMTRTLAAPLATPPML
jgi:hypothetical protein